jgi:hypothetical protein
MNKHDEIKKLLGASRKMLTNDNLQEQLNNIGKSYQILNEQFNNDYETAASEDTSVTKKIDIGQSVEDEIAKDDKSSKKDKKQGYKISGNKLVLHGKDSGDLTLTTDEKLAFQQTIDEFINEVSDMVEFNQLNVYPNNVEWSGYITDLDIEFIYTIGESDGVYLNGTMMKTDDNFLEMINKLKSYYEKFKSKWAKILNNRKKTKPKED